MCQCVPQIKFPDVSLTLTASCKIPWLAKKFPDFSLTLKRTGISLTFSWPWQPCLSLAAESNRCVWLDISDVAENHQLIMTQCPELLKTISFRWDRWLKGWWKESCIMITMNMLIWFYHGITQKWWQCYNADYYHRYDIMICWWQWGCDDNGDRMTVW